MFVSCIIVDDEPHAIEILQDYIEKVPFLNLLHSFRDPMEFLHYYNEHPVDLLFLDINMPGISGLRLVKNIKQKTSVVFTTAYNEYALQGFDVNALDFLVKPIAFERFLQAATKASDWKRLKEQTYSNQPATEASKKEFLFLKSGTAIYKIALHEILFLEKDGNYFKIYTGERNYLIRMNFTQIMNQLPKETFIRIHKSYIIHLRFVDKVEINSVYLKNHQLPISQNFRVDLLQAIANIQ